MDIMFFANSVLLGNGLTVDAFSVSVADGLEEKKVKKGRAFLIAAIFAAFQFIMPIIGWICVHKISENFTNFQKIIPYLALFLLSFIGIKTIVDGTNKSSASGEKMSVGALLMQGIATSVDAFSVGFTNSEYEFKMAAAEAAIIAAITFAVCLAGVLLGRKFGAKLTNRAQIVGGIILILIGIEIFITGII